MTIQFHLLHKLNSPKFISLSLLRLWACRNFVLYKNGKSSFVWPFENQNNIRFTKLARLFFFN